MNYSQPYEVQLAETEYDNAMVEVTKLEQALAIARAKAELKRALLQKARYDHASY